MEFRFNAVAQAAARLQADSADPVCAYIYDLPALRRHVQSLVASLPANCELFYAVKANAERPVLDVLEQHLHGFEVASGGEIDWVRQQFPEVPLIFGGPGKLDSELTLALAQRVELVHVESLAELRRLAALLQAQGGTQAILLRMNLALPSLPQTTLTMGGKPTPFGIDPVELPACIDFIRAHPQLQLRGFHFHLVSHQQDAGAHLALLADYFRQVRHWREQFGLKIDHINVGGGIGINYRAPESQFDWEQFSAGLHRLIAREQMASFRIRFECGRYLTAPCGYYLMEVLELKRNHGSWFAICRGGTHHFRTPAAQGHDHPFRRLPGGSGERLRGQKVTVVGQLCTPKDVLASQVEVAELAVGDLLLFSLAGAYAWNISHQQFLRHPAPLMHYIDETEPA
ncbi:type III PLP-dependent enzyme [Marinobacterium rhizophilum]|uniref:Type III PLP-dependent enzyme n=1 Tax=Marinobacterium rhizophilum TaxID=420402 RepID=A0ABY5HF10_9GAMM|nr:type III PLP-dependent enzyme [Marinobacterium rhizophilum]UTW10823.1 type III PLP-dependent enzyme [Marinobacterium rhizophilum]